MFNPFICGSFPHAEAEDADDEPWSPSSSPRKSRKSRASKNPYANRGLDKFSALVADHDNKRRKIYTQMGSQDLFFVRFAYSRSNHCKPIIVKVRDKKRDKTTARAAENVKDKPITYDHHVEEAFTTLNEVQQPRRMLSHRKAKKSFSWWYYLPAIVVLILLFLAMFGKSFVILCTSLGWYLVPTIEGVTYNLKRPRKKENFSRLRGNI